MHVKERRETCSTAATCTVAWMSNADTLLLLLLVLMLLRRAFKEAVFAASRSNRACAT